MIKNTLSLGLIKAFIVAVPLAFVFQSLFILFGSLLMGNFPSRGDIKWAFDLSNTLSLILATISFGFAFLQASLFLWFLLGHRNNRVLGVFLVPAKGAKMFCARAFRPCARSHAPADLWRHQSWLDSQLCALCEYKSVQIWKTKQQKCSHFKNQTTQVCALCKAKKNN